MLYAFLQVVKVGFNVFKRTCAAEVEEGFIPAKDEIVLEGSVPEESVSVLEDPARSFAIAAANAASEAVSVSPFAAASAAAFAAAASAAACAAAAAASAAAVH